VRSYEQDSPESEETENIVLGEKSNGDGSYSLKVTVFLFIRAAPEVFFFW
jgi:hypothetical protein